MYILYIIHCQLNAIEIGYVDDSRAKRTTAAQHSPGEARLADRLHQGRRHRVRDALEHWRARHVQRERV